LYFLIRAVRNPGYWSSLANRLGFLPRSFKQTGPGSIWLHAVSVGEILSCVSFLRQLRREFPRTRLFVSTSTLAGRATANEKLTGIADGVFYVPVDTAFAVRRVLRTLRPGLVIVAETEIWPNLFREIKRTGAALLLVNGRLSDRAFPRYLRFRRLFHAVLPAADSIEVQTDTMRERFLALGAPAGRVRVTGNFKYDFEPREAPPESPVRQLLASRPARVWIAASTMPPAHSGDIDEDDVVIAAFRAVAPRFPDLLLILVPRKPERFDAVAEKLQAAGLRFLRRSRLPAETSTAPQVLLLDTIGELSGLFALADVVFMGGSLANRGGHNILEPALFGKPVIFGPHMENFQAVAEEFRQGRAAWEIAQPEQLAEAVAHLLAGPAAAGQMGERARTLAEASRGATARAVQQVRELYSRTIPRYRPAFPWLPLRWALAKLWDWGGGRRQRRALAAQRTLPVPVVSVGNLSMGGTGKTPCVLWLAAALRGNGRKPGILTRGYGRVSPDRQLILPPGARLPVASSGDEPQIFLRSGIAPVGIGADRFQAGAALLQQFDVNVLLLDDGFQHRKLGRNLDVVLIDAINPFGGGELFPLGRLREPVSALSRAGMVVITRAEFSDLGPAIEHTIRLWNPTAPIVYGVIEPVAWVESRTGREFNACERPFGAAAGFCGLGNPLSFRRTLESLDIAPVDWVEFEDHHRYRPHELRRIATAAAAKGAAALVTTEKDSVNLCEGCDDLLAPLPLYWLKIGMRLRPETEILAALERAV
jgi:3-deoxy-D-manno-octulosonic-acid transferase